MEELLLGIESDNSFPPSHDGGLPERIALTENIDNLTLRNKTVLDAAVAFSCFQKLRAIHASDREAFETLHAVVHNTGGASFGALERLRNAGLLDDNNVPTFGVKDVFESAVKPDNKAELLRPFTDDDEDQLALWMKQLLRDRLRKEGQEETRPEAEKRKR